MIWEKQKRKSSVDETEEAFTPIISEKKESIEGGYKLASNINNKQSDVIQSSSMFIRNDWIKNKQTRRSVLLGYIIGTSIS